MFLVKNGVQEDIAWNLDDAERTARCVVFAGFEDHDFDWHTMQFVIKR